MWFVLVTVRTTVHLSLTAQSVNGQNDYKAWFILCTYVNTECVNRPSRGLFSRQLGIDDAFLFCSHAYFRLLEDWRRPFVASPLNSVFRLVTLFLYLSARWRHLHRWMPIVVNIIIIITRYVLCASPPHYSNSSLKVKQLWWPLCLRAKQSSIATHTNEFCTRAIIL